MPMLVPHDHKYWCPGPWPWEWANTCTRHGHAWQYQFDWVDHTGYFLFTDHVGCEAGIKYSWTTPTGGLGLVHKDHVTEFFDDRLAPEGECAMTGAGGYALTSSAGVMGRPPGLAVFKNSLYAAWKGMLGDRGICWSSFDGQDWAPQRHIENVGTSNGPSIAVFNDQLYAAWKGMEGDESIWWSSFNGLQGWAPQRQIENVGTSIGPSLALFNDQLYAVWKGLPGDQGIWWSSFDGQGWAPQRHIEGVGTSPE